jgi:hypothetical protein
MEVVITYFEVLQGICQDELRKSRIYRWLQRSAVQDMKARPAEHKAEVLPNLPWRSADNDTHDDYGNMDRDNSYAYFATNKYKLKHCG